MSVTIILHEMNLLTSFKYITVEPSLHSSSRKRECVRNVKNIRF